MPIYSILPCKGNVEVTKKTFNEANGDTKRSKKQSAISLLAKKVVLESLL